MKAAGGVAQHHVHVPGLGGLEGVEQHGAGIGALVLADDVHPSAVCPDLQLIGGGGAEGIRRAQQHLLALPFQPVGQLADGRGLAHAVDADHKHHGGGVLHVQGRIAHVQAFAQNIPQGALDLIAGHIHLLIGSLLQLLHRVLGQLHAHVGQDKGFLQIVVKVVVQRVPGDGRQPGFFQFCKQTHCGPSYLILYSLASSLRLAVSTREMPRSCMVTP